MKNILLKFERFIVTVIILMMIIIIFISTIELGVILVVEFVKPPKYLLGLTNLLEIFGFFNIFMKDFSLI